MFNKKIGLFTVLSTLFLFFNTQISYAQENIAGFLYTLSLPDNQNQNINKYFDLTVVPGQKQDIKINILNTSDEDISIDVKLNNAKTNKRGVIEYGQSDIEDDKSLKTPFTSVASSEKKIQLKKNENKDLIISLTIPDNEFDGIILGGIELTKETSTEENNNIYRNLIGIILRENDTPIVPKLEFNSIRAVSYVENGTYNNSILVNYSNSSPVIIDDMSIVVQVNKTDNPNLIYKVQKDDMRMAPNSNITIPIAMQNDTVKSGEYEAVIRVTNSSGSINEEWHETFEISNETADNMNQNIAYFQSKEKSFPIILPIIIIVVITIIIGLLVYFKFLKKKKK